jgi:hypothetical protein
MVPRQNPNRRKQEGGPISSPPKYEVEEIWKKKTRETLRLSNPNAIRSHFCFCLIPERARREFFPLFLTLL